MLCPISSFGPRRFLAAAAWVLLALLVFAAPRAGQAQGAVPLDIYSVVHVTVANEPELTGDYTVDGSGNISMLYVNTVKVQGLTLPQARTLITDRLRKYYKNPQVLVTMVSPGGIGVDVTGTVTSPKHYVLRSDAHLNDLLIQAVPALNADINHVEIAHGGPGQAKSTETVNYLSYLNDKVGAGNPPLHDFDVVNVPQKKDAQPIQINVQGQVAKPGRIAVPINTTAYAALQDAGDLTPTADRERISIKHSGQTEETPLQYAQAREHLDDVSVNPVLLDGDTIIVNALPIPTTVGPNGVPVPTNTYTLTGPGIHNQAEYKLDGPSVSLESAIARAGGLSDRAKVDQIQITRSTVSGKTSLLKLDARDPEKRRNFQVLPGDNIDIGQGSQPQHIDPFQLIGLGLALFGIFGHR